MSAIQQLEDALQERNKKTDEFLQAIMDRINESISHLSTCTRANAPPEVAGSVKVLRKDLDEIIGKIKDNSNIDEHATQGLINRLKLTNLKKQDLGLVPTPPDPNDLRFSDRSSIGSTYGTPRPSDASSYGTPVSSPFATPRSSVASSFSTPRSSESEGSSKPVYPFVRPNADGEYDFDQLPQPPRPPQPPRGGKTRRR
jgi:hypothetical protein